MIRDLTNELMPGTEYLTDQELIDFMELNLSLQLVPDEYIEENLEIIIELKKRIRDIKIDEVLNEES